MSSVTYAAWPPGPTEAASEQVRRWIETPVDFWVACERTYGPTIALDLGSLGSTILLADPEMVRQVFQLSGDRFEVRKYNEHYRYVMGEQSVLLQDGETHRRQRRMLNPALRHDQVLPKAASIRDVVARTVASWPAGEPFNPRPDLHEVTFLVIVELVFGDLSSATSQALIAAHRQAVLQQVGSWGPWRNFSRLQPWIREQVRAELEARRADPTIPGALTRFALARDNADAPLSAEECADHVFSLLIAGVDTTAVSLSWALYWLAREPRVRDALLAELGAVNGAASTLSPQELLALPYLHAVFSETLRMYPIVPTPSGRRLLADTPIGDFVFPAGTTLVPCTYLVHRREDLYPDADRFVPERFLDQRFPSHAYFPFGGGVRRCVGEMLAELEFKVALTTILERWAIQPSDVVLPAPVRHGTLLAPADSFRVTVEPVGASTGEGRAWS